MTLHGHLVHNENQTSIGANGDWRPEDYSFPRQQSRWSRPIEPSPPVESWGRTCLQGLYFLASMVGVFFALYLIDFVWGQ